ncbi:MAG: hypothetical protein WCD89_02990 [Anaerocolumna sp.]
MTKKKVGLIEFVKFYKENGKAFKAYPLRDQSKVTITLANMKLAKIDPLSKIYEIRLTELNDAMLYHYSGKWYATLALKSKSKEEWEKAFDAFKLSLNISKQLQVLLDDDLSASGDKQTIKRISYDRPKIEKKTLRSCSGRIFL